ncbi:hypothetical protein RugamoR64_39760 [Duganella rhizosphaerae]|uniref:hypothetical protein n=1 Tax=Duganella rhizosphaerae TaxID=2885763 RepID=UPI0030E87055
MTLKDDIASNGVPAGTYAIQCVQNGKYIGPDQALYSRILAVRSEPDPINFFQFRRFDNGSTGLFNLHHNAFVSLISETRAHEADWYLVAGVKDAMWAAFSIERNSSDGDNDFWLRSTHPAAQNFPYVQVLTADFYMGVIKTEARHEGTKLTSDPLWQKLRVTKMD